MRYLFICLFVITFSNITLAQSGKRSTYRDETFLVSIGGGAEIPIGSARTTFAYCIPGDLQLEYKISPYIGITGDGSYISYVKKDIIINGTTSYGGTIAIITAMGGLKYTFDNDFYLHPQLGLARSSSLIGTKISYAMGVGYDFSRNFDAEAKVLGIGSSNADGGSLNTFGVRIGYNF